MSDRVFAKQPQPATNLCGSAIAQALQHMGTARYEMIAGWLEKNGWSAHPQEVQSLLWAEIRAGRIEAVDGWYAPVNGAPLRFVLAPEERALLERIASSLETIAYKSEEGGR